MRLTMRLEDELTDAMRRLRETSYADHLCTEDEFDAYSRHVTVWLGEEPVAMARITPCDRSMLRSESSGQVAVPVSAEVVELTRGIVREDMRQIGLYSLFVSAGLLAACRAGASEAVAIVRTGLPARPALHRLGFQDWGSPVWHEAYGCAGQPLRMNLRGAERRLAAQLEEQVERMAQRGIEVVCAPFENAAEECGAFPASLAA